MKNQVAYRSDLLSESINLVTQQAGSVTFIEVLKFIRKWILGTRPFVLLASFCSAVLGEEVGALKAFHLVHAFVAFLAMCFLGGYSAWAQVALLVWFGLTALQCKRDGWGKE